MFEADPELIESVAFIMFDCIHAVLEKEVNIIFLLLLLKHNIVIFEKHIRNLIINIDIIKDYWNDEIEEAWGHLFYEIAKGLKEPFNRTPDS